MTALPEVLGVMKKNFLVIAHRARTDDGIHLNDLCGASGRWDGVARSITSALFLSHGMRRDTAIHILLMGPDDPPKLLSIRGDNVRYLNPDERASAALMKKSLSTHLPKENGTVVTPSPGITIARAGLGTALSSFSGRIVLLDENGSPFDAEFLKDHQEGPLMFVLSDDMDLSGEESEMILERSVSVLSLGRSVLHTQMVITILHYIMEKAGV